MADMYFQSAADFSIKLDEGLSNYGMDEEGRLYYLDDDIYPLDKFVVNACLRRFVSAV